MSEMLDIGEQPLLLDDRPAFVYVIQPGRIPIFMRILVDSKADAAELNDWVTAHPDIEASVKHCARTVAGQIASNTPPSERCFEPEWN